jgi:hypothetical protein
VWCGVQAQYASVCLMAPALLHAPRCPRGVFTWFACLPEPLAALLFAGLTVAALLGGLKLAEPNPFGTVWWLCCSLYRLCHPPPMASNLLQLVFL